MGVYIHIPFCRSKCFYCGFYSVVSPHLQEAYLRALGVEMELRKAYLPVRKADTLYLGGGTPSGLSGEQLGRVVGKVRSIWTLAEDAECTIEMNPEDVTREKLAVIRHLGFNRLSIGVQSFNDAVLKRINRRHTAGQALEAVRMAEEAGFGNIGIDLIIGLPGRDAGDLEKELEIAGRLPLSHLSVYILSIDSDSVFQKLSGKGKFKLPEDDLLCGHYLMVSDRLKEMGYEHYEISNFAKEGRYSRHNTAYWQQKPYIGLGPSAHSFDVESRQWNVSGLKAYIAALDGRRLPFEREVLTPENRYNEYLMTNFRTMWGIEVACLRADYPLWWKRTEDKIGKYCALGLMEDRGDRIRMTERGWLVSDGIFSDLFV